MSNSHIYVYHYASEQYTTLKTRKAQGLTAPTMPPRHPLNKTPGDYTEHISFFVEPVPLEIMGRVYGKDHPVWHSGNALYEHRVDMTKVKSFKYHFTETPEKIALLFNDSVDTEEYYRRMTKINAQKGYIGSGLSEFYQPYRKFQGQAKRHILRADSFPKWEENRLKYAALVPHVMVYPKSGEMEVEFSQKVTIA